MTIYTIKSIFISNANAFSFAADFCKVEEPSLRAAEQDLAAIGCLLASCQPPEDFHTLLSRDNRPSRRQRKARPPRTLNLCIGVTQAEVIYSCSIQIPAKFTSDGTSRHIECTQRLTFENVST